MNQVFSIFLNEFCMKFSLLMFVNYTENQLYLLEKRIELSFQSLGLRILALFQCWHCEIYILSQMDYESHYEFVRFKQCASSAS